MRPLLVTILLVLTGCEGVEDGIDGDGDAAGADAALCSEGFIGQVVAGNFPEDECYELTSESIGDLPLFINYEGVNLSVVEWSPSPAAPENKIGFVIDANTSVAYLVRSGAKTFVGTNARFSHPDGINAEPIKTIVFCPNDSNAVSSDGGPCS